MARIDYAQVPALEKPPLENMASVRRCKINKNNYTCLKYIDNKYINSPNKSYNGVALVGLSKTTGKWGILRVWRYW